MKVRLVLSPFVGVILIVLFSTGETVNGIADFQKYSILGFSIFSLQYFGNLNSVQCTQEEERREPRLIKELTMLNRQSCLSKILCGVEVAKPPTKKSTTLNDYAFIVKRFFDFFSLGGSSFADLDDDDNTSKSDEEEEDVSTNAFRSPSQQRHNSKKPKLPDLSDLEELLDQPENVFFRKRSGRKLGYFGYTNPRFDKTAFLNKKQLELEKAGNENEKMQIAREVAAKMQSPRQCRMLSWFGPQYTTTTTITTTSNDPSVASVSQSDVGPTPTNSMCPFTGSELQKMILNEQKGLTATGTVSPLATATASPSKPAETMIKIPYETVNKGYQYQSNQPPQKHINKMPLGINAYGESDPDLLLHQEDPFYSLLPPEVSAHEDKEREQTASLFQTYGFSSPSAGSNFYLNSEGPGIRYPEKAVVKFIHTSTTTTTTTQKPRTKKPRKKDADEDSEEDEEEDEEADADDSLQRQTEPPPFLGPPPNRRNRINWRIPNKIRVTLPSLRGMGNSRRYSSNHNQPHIPVPDPVMMASEEEEDSGEKRGAKREALETSRERGKMTLKTSLEIEEKIMDQRVPPVVIPSSGVPHIIRYLPRQSYKPPPLPPKRKDGEGSEKGGDDEENSEEEDDEEDDEERSNLKKPHGTQASGPSNVGQRPSSTSIESEEDEESQEVFQNAPQAKSQNSPAQQTQTTSPPKKSYFPLPIHLPMFFKSKPKTTTTTTTTTTPKPTPRYKPPKLKDLRGQNNSSNGILKHILSDHGLRTLSTIQNMFYGPPSNDDVHPHADSPGHDHDHGPPQSPPKGGGNHADDLSDDLGPPPPRRRPPNGPPRRRRPPGGKRRRRPRPRPQDDEDNSDEEDEEEEDEEKKTTTPKPTPPTSPTPRPLNPLLLPPRVVAVPIYLEGKEAWEGLERPNEEEFFEPKTKKRTKPEKYDYDDESVEYSQLADKAAVKLNQNRDNPYDNRFVHGLPTTWEEIFQEFRQQQEDKKRKKAQEDAEKKKLGSGSEESEEEEEEEEDIGGGAEEGHKSKRRRPPHHSSSVRRRRPPSASNQYLLEPID